ncbi:HD domain-containing protein [Desulfobaculum bizertense]|uniref:HD domain-containing protein n=1 Tax=Desulfobaculum bizertense DSM 18034 TaxID=1121442 RepID=A0A1T4VG56_9BACT|nr:HD domain-containing protein [Desulfobaculum bizertense]UIJ37770.1 HDIG domain-containing protein [Desulfobaculum bizertense]SKA63929.1 hypothetical protein SAMN02745702_00239 [Desulfobaculum bizertense DSM 18034]
MISRDEAYQMVKESNPPSLLHHAEQTEAVMRALAKHFNEDVELWGITGLLHDLDYPQTKDELKAHGAKSREMLEGKLPEDALYAIVAHNSEYTEVDPKSHFDYALRAGETVTGLITAAALVRPNRMEGMKPKSLKKKMKDKSFAASVDRDRIRECDKLDMELAEFLQLSIDAITGVAAETGLV